MTEAAAKWLFTETDVRSFWAITQDSNKGSIAILRRLGATLTEEKHMGVDDLCRFDVTRSAWAEAQTSTQD